MIDFRTKLKMIKKTGELFPEKNFEFGVKLQI